MPSSLSVVTQNPQGVFAQEASNVPPLPDVFDMARPHSSLVQEVLSVGRKVKREVS